MKNAPSPDSIARIVRWALLLFFAYALWHTTPTFRTAVPPNAPSASQQLAQKSVDCNVKASSLQDIPLLSIPLFGAMVPNAHIEDKKPGSGEPALCGQLATLSYSLALKRRDEPFYESGERTVTLGEHDLLAGMNRGIIGMKPQGERIITIPQPLAFDNDKDLKTFQGSDRFKLPADVKLKDEIVVAHVMLSKLSPDAPTSAMPLRYIDSTRGNGTHVECGDTVRMALTVWKMDGTQLFSTQDKPITFTLGESQVPYGIELGTQGMMERGKRTLIVPPAYAEPLVKDSSRTTAAPLIPVTFPEHEMVLVEITLLPAVEEQSKPAPEKKIDAPGKK